MTPLPGGLGAAEEQGDGGVAGPAVWIEDPWGHELQSPSGEEAHGERSNAPKEVESLAKS